MTIFGVHTGLQYTTVGELLDLWRDIERLGFGWISIWDHFYAADGTGDPHCLEGVAAHAALACTTSTVECGALVYCVGYRHPAVLAKAVTTIDHLSGGRAAIGLGAGWSELEYRAFGIPFPSSKVRLDMLDEAAACVRGLLHQEVTSFEGQHFRLHEARNEPAPVRGHIPVWIGGGGEKRTLRIAAMHADGWNVPFVSPAEFSRKRAVLHAHCEEVGRDPAAIRCAANVGLARDEDDLIAQFGALRPLVEPGVIVGSDDQLVDRVGQYVDAGADQINIALRYPWKTDALERFSAAVGLQEAG